MEATRRPTATSTALGLMTATILVVAPLGTASARSDDRPDGVLFREGFDDARLLRRGWYNGDAFVITEAGARAGEGCIAYHWKPGTTTPEGSSPARRLFTPTDTVYVRFFLKLSPAGRWTGRAHHPHPLNILTADDDRDAGPAARHLSQHLEPEERRHG